MMPSNRYAEIIATGEKAATEYEAFVTGLRDQINYLELDMSDTAVSKLHTASSDTNARARELMKSLGELNQVTKTYIKGLK